MNSGKETWHWNRNWQDKKNSLKWYTNRTLCFISHGHNTGLTNGMSFIFTLCFAALCWELWWPTSHLRLWVSPFVNNFLLPLSLTFPSCPLRLNPRHYQWQQRNWKAYITLRGALDDYLCHSTSFWSPDSIICVYRRVAAPWYWSQVGLLHLRKGCAGHLHFVSLCQ